MVRKKGELANQNPFKRHLAFKNVPLWKQTCHMLHIWSKIVWIIEVSTCS
jgi:hypothetical protein